jgi:hypothetical protein
MSSAAGDPWASSSSFDEFDPDEPLDDDTLGDARAADEFGVRLEWPAGVQRARETDPVADPPAIAPPRPAEPRPARPSEPTESQVGMVFTTVHTLIEGVLAGIASLRTRLDALTDVHTSDTATITSELARLREEIDAASTRPAAPAPVAPDATSGDTLDELARQVAALRDEVAQLRRRLPVRSKTAVTLDDDQLDRIADVVVTRVLEQVDVEANPPETA